MKYILLLTILGLLSAISATLLDDYVNEESPDFKWRAVPDLEFKTLLGGKGYVLNVTSLKWGNDTKVKTPTHNLWSHQVVVIVPKHVKYTNISVAWKTLGSCNEHPDVKVNTLTDPDILIADEVAHHSYTVTIAIKQVPICPMIWKSDPKRKHRSEDSQIAWGWKEYLDDPYDEPIWLPMVKASFYCMKAAQEFMKQEKIADSTGWVVAGASKRGWTTFLTGAASRTCTWCPKVLGIVPLVPIVPDLKKEFHRQWQAYNGFTWAIKDYAEANLTERIDSPEMDRLQEIIDPINYLDRLDHIPKLVVLSSDDEFMMMDWTNIYWDKIGGEKHLLITPNAEHILVTGLKTIFQSMTAFVRSIGSNNTVEDRPKYDYEFRPETGEIIVKIPEQKAKLKRVSLSYAETVQSERRDFRWVIQAPDNEKCKWPYIPVPGSVAEYNKHKYSLDDDQKLCVQPIVWKNKELKFDKSVNGYFAKAPVPKHEGRWVGYYVDVYFHGDTEMEPFSFIKDEYHFTTPGWTNPQTLPFEDCHDAGCIGRLV